MPTFNQIARSIYRPRKKRNVRVPALSKKPQRRATCIRLFTTTPRKPNSAQRKVAKIKYRSVKKHEVRLKTTFVFIPGEVHTLKEHGVILFRGGRTQDLPSFKYKAIRGKGDLKGLPQRTNARSKYGVKRIKNKSNLVPLLIDFIFLSNTCINVLLIYIMSKINNTLENNYRATPPKQIGILYFIFGGIAGIIGTFFSLIMRLELSQPGDVILQHNFQFYNVIVTAHAFILILFSVISIIMGGVIFAKAFKIKAIIKDQVSKVWSNAFIRVVLKNLPFLSLDPEKTLILKVIFTMTGIFMATWVVMNVYTHLVGEPERTAAAVLEETNKLKLQDQLIGQNSKLEQVVALKVEKAYQLESLKSTINTKLEKVDVLEQELLLVRENSLTVTNNLQNLIVEGNNNLNNQLLNLKTEQISDLKNLESSVNNGFDKVEQLEKQVVLAREHINLVNDHILDLAVQMALYCEQHAYYFKVLSSGGGCLILLVVILLVNVLSKNLK